MVTTDAYFQNWSRGKVTNPQELNDPDFLSSEISLNDLSFLDDDLFKEFDANPRQFLIQHESNIGNVVKGLLNKELAEINIGLFENIYSSLLRHAYFICEPQLMEDMLKGLFLDETGRLDQNIIDIIKDSALDTKTVICTEILGIEDSLRDCGINFDKPT